MKRLVLFVIAAALTFTAVTAGAYWSADSVTGGSAAAAVASVNQGATPTVSAVGQTITVTWAATTLSDGQAVGGYVVKRYDATTLVLQPMLSACAGTITSTSCVESAVPEGSWKYSITPVFAMNWQGPQSAESVTAETVTEHDQLGGVSAADASGPTGGSVDASGLVGTEARYSTSTSLNLALAKGSDPSGLAAAGHQLLRATATLTNGTCGSFGSYTLVAGGTDPASPKADTVADDACYSYEYVVTDTLGNSTTYTSPQIKVDTTPPAAPTLAFTAFDNTYWAGSGTTVYYRSAATTGSVTTTATAADGSGIASYAFPALGTGWTTTPGALGVTTYSWSGTPAAPGTQQVTATNNAGGVSANSPFTLSADDTAPTTGTVTYADTTQTATTVSVAFTTGTDAASGVGTRLLQRASATLTGSTCGTFGAFVTVTGGTNPASSPVVDTVTSGSCYKYQYVVSDNVGNVDAATSADIVKVTSYTATISATSGLHNYFRLGDAVGSTVMDDITTTNNNGTFFNAPTRGAGALNGDANTAVQFDGSTQYATATRQISGDFSIELWVKSTQSFSNDFGQPHCTYWWQGAGLVDADVSGSFNDFGLSMCSGMIVAGVGSPDVSIATSATYNDGSWHHVVFTRTQTGGAMALYVDGAPVGTVTGSTNALTSQATLDIGRSTAAVNYFAGTMDEIALYTTVLTPTVVASHYAAR